MEPHIEAPGNFDAWYSYDGAENDVVLSTRVRLARNLANFPFPSKLRGTDGQRIQSIVFDAFNQFDTKGQFQAIAIDKLDPLGSRILQERGVLDSSDFCSTGAKTADGTGAFIGGPSQPKNDGDESRGIVMRTDGKVSCTVNATDHVQIASFVPRLDVDNALSLCREVDEGMQKSIQFAASYEFGYLTSVVTDAGSGMKVSLRVHLPSLSVMGRIPTVSADMLAKGVLFTACYGAGGADAASVSGGRGASLGAYYQLSSTNSFNGSEYDQTAAIAAAGKQLAELERKARQECKEKMPTDIRNEVYRAYALSRFSKYITLREAIDIVSGVKWGKDLELLNGIGDAELHALLYRIQQAHLEFVLKSGDFNFEKDIADNTDKKVCRLRALILQEAFEDVHLAE